MKFIAEILLETGRLETGWFSRQAHQNNEQVGLNLRAKRCWGVQKNLMAGPPRGRPVHDSVTAGLALGKSAASGHLPARLGQHHILIKLFQPSELPMPHNATNHALSEPSANEIGPDYTSLRAMREIRGYSLEELSLTCGLSVDEIEDIENGRAADPSKLRRIASALRLPQDALVAPAAPAPAAQGRPLA